MKMVQWMGMVRMMGDEDGTVQMVTAVSFLAGFRRATCISVLE